MEEAYITLIKHMDDYCILTTKDGDIISSIEDENSLYQAISEALRTYTFGLDPSKKSIIDSLRYEPSVIKVSMDYIYDNLIDEDKDFAVYHTKIPEMYIIKCNKGKNLDDLFSSGIQPGHVRILTNDIMKELSKNYMPKE